MLLHFREPFQVILHRLDGYAGLAESEHANGGGPLFCPCVMPLLAPVHRRRFSGSQCGLQTLDFVVEFLGGGFIAFGWSLPAMKLHAPKPTLRRESSRFE